MKTKLLAILVGLLSISCTSLPESESKEWQKKYNTCIQKAEEYQNLRYQQLPSELRGLGGWYNLVKLYKNKPTNLIKDAESLIPAYEKFLQTKKYPESLNEVAWGWHEDSKQPLGNKIALMFRDLEQEDCNKNNESCFLDYKILPSFLYIGYGQPMSIFPFPVDDIKTKGSLSIGSQVLEGHTTRKIKIITLSNDYVYFEWIDNSAKTNGLSEFHALTKRNKELTEQDQEYMYSARAIQDNCEKFNQN